MEEVYTQGRKWKMPIRSRLYSLWIKKRPRNISATKVIAITNLPPRPMMGIESCGMLLSAIHTEEGEEKLHLLMVDPHIPAGAKLY